VIGTRTASRVATRLLDSEEDLARDRKKGVRRARIRVY